MLFNAVLDRGRKVVGDVATGVSSSFCLYLVDSLLEEKTEEEAL